MAERVVAGRHDNGQFYSDLTGEEVANILNAYASGMLKPVVPSKWKYYHKQGKAVCMNCSFERGVDDNFGRAVACPNCGARMDGE